MSAPAPQRPPRLPNPGVCSNGKVMCNEPLSINGTVLGYCEETVWPPYRQTRRRRAGHVGRPHRITWWTA